MFAAGGAYQSNLIEILNPDEDVPAAYGDLSRDQSREWHTLDLASVPDQFALMIETRIGSLNSGAGTSDITRIPVESKDYQALAELAITGSLRRWVRVGGPFRQARSPGEQPRSDLTWEQLLAATPFARTRQWTVELNNGIPAPLIIVAGDSAGDHALAMLCDRTYGNAAWLPVTAARGDDEVGAALRAVMHDLWNSWKQPYGASQAPMWMFSISMTSNDLAALAKELEPDYASAVDTSARPEPWILQVTLDSLRQQPWHRWLGAADYFKIPINVPVNVTDIAVELATPLMTPLPDARSHLGEELRWQADVIMPGHQLPQLAAPPRNLLSADDPGFFPEASVRISHLGLCYSSDKAGFAVFGAGPEEAVARPRLRFPTASTIFGEAARRKGATVRLSIAGRRASLAIRKWGSLEALTGALQGTFRTLLDAFAAPRASGDYGVGYSVRNKGYVSHDYAARVAGDAARRLLDELSSRSLVRRGLILTCDRCWSRDFIPITAIAETYNCAACGTPNYLVDGQWAKNTMEPEWFYDLDPVMRDLLRDHGDVPLLAVARLRQNARSVLYCPELEILTEGGGPGAETDICVIIDGQIITGEAKSNDKVDGSTRKASNKIIKVAEVLGADRIVLATATDHWAPGVRTAVDNALNSATANFWRGAPAVEEMVAVRPAPGEPSADYSGLLGMDPHEALAELLALPTWAAKGRRDALAEVVRAGLASRTTEDTPDEAEPQQD